MKFSRPIQVPLADPKIMYLADFLSNVGVPTIQMDSP